MRVLIVSANAFSETRNNGKTLEAIFHVFRKQDLAQVISRPQVGDDYSYSSSTYCITELDIVYKLLHRSKACGSVVDYSETNSIATKFDSIKNHSYYCPEFRDMIWSTGAWKTKSFESWIREFNPNIVFLVGGPCKYLHDIACYAVRITDAVLISYFTDDYILNLRKSGLKNYLRFFFRNTFYRKTINNSMASYCIGEHMSNAYSNLFHKKFGILINSINTTAPFPSREKENKLTISYLGSLHTNRWKLISRLSRCISDNAIINVYSFSRPSDEILSSFKDSGVCYKGSCTSLELEKIKASSDMLLHVESPEKKDVKVTQYSISTKIPEYLMSGRLLLAFGPREIASMKLICDNNIGVYIDCRLDDETINSQFNDIVANYGDYNQIIEKGYSYAVENFDVDINSKRFMHQLQKILENNKGSINI